MGMKHRKEVRLEHIAKEAGVSIVTVSNALNGRKGVSGEMRDRICRIALEMGYFIRKPESRKRQMCRIGVVIAERYVKQLPSLYMDIYRRIARALNQSGSVPVLEIVDGDRERMLHGFTPFLADSMEGIIIIGEMSRDYILCVRKEYRIPVVCVDFYDVMPDMDYIVCDCFAGMEQLTDFLLDAGCTRLAFAGDPHASGSIMDGYLGFCKALEKRGIEVRAEDVISDRSSDGNEDRLQTELPEILPDAFVCSCQRTAELLTGRLMEKGIRIPEEVSVAGFDCGYCSIRGGMALTTYERDREALAAISAGTILKRIVGRNRAAGIRFTEGRLVPGDTVRMPGGAG